MIHRPDSEYYRGRERAEREAAQQATCAEAKRVHEKLASAYAELWVQARAGS